MEPHDIDGIPGVEEIRNGNNLLVDAVRGGNLEIIEQILQAGVDINEPRYSGATPIVESKNGTVAQFLIARGADVNHATNRTMRTPLMHAVQRLSIQVWISENNDCIKEVISVLLENGADVNARTSNGRTPLMLAATVPGQTDILQLLLDHGADYTARDNKGNTALIHAAIERGCSDNAIFLIQLMENNTDLLNVQNNSGSTALMCSVSHHGWRIASELTDKGADVNITDKNGNTALFIAVSAFLEKRILEHLIGAGCDVNHQNNAGLSPLMLAVKLCNYTDTVHLLIASGADVNAVNHKDTTKTALSYFKNNLEQTAINCLDALLDKGADACYISPGFLENIISRSPSKLIPKLIPKLIRCGLAPHDYNIDDMPEFLKYRMVMRVPSMSPLCLAVHAGNVTLARYFWENQFLTNLDLSLASNNDIRRVLQELQYKECLLFLDEIGSRPISLLKTVGASSGRETRVNELPLPSELMDKLDQPENEYRKEEYSEDESSEDESSEDESSENEYSEDDYSD